MVVDYSTVTEVSGDKATQEQLARMFHRYRFASDYCEGKDVLEVACGSGQGLGYLAKKARWIVGGDCTARLVRSARQYYRNRVQVHLLDAEHLPFTDDSFDVVILYEAIYYLTYPEQFLSEAQRVLRKGGVLLIATVNKDWPEFNPSPFSTSYFSVPDLNRVLRENGFETEFYGAFSVLPNTLTERFISKLRKVAVRLHLVPKTMKGKELLKKVFYGKLVPLKAEIQEGMCEYVPPEPLSAHTINSEYKVIYSVARI